MIENMGRYYQWADQRIIALLEPLDEELFGKKPQGVERPLRDLVEHLVVYYEYYTCRESGCSFQSLQAKLKKMSKKELLNHWEKVMGSFARAVNGRKEQRIAIPVSKNQSAEVSGNEYLFCYSDHASYHRGQLVAVYKAVTGKKAVATDYYDFLISRLKKSDAT